MKKVTLVTLTFGMLFCGVQPSFALSPQETLTMLQSKFASYTNPNVDRGLVLTAGEGKVCDYYTVQGSGAQFQGKRVLTFDRSTLDKKQRHYTLSYYEDDYTKKSYLGTFPLRKKRSRILSSEFVRELFASVRYSGEANQGNKNVMIEVVDRGTGSVGKAIETQIRKGSADLLAVEYYDCAAKDILTPLIALSDRAAKSRNLILRRNSTRVGPLLYEVKMKVLHELDNRNVRYIRYR